MGTIDDIILGRSLSTTTVNYYEAAAEPRRASGCGRVRWAACSASLSRGTACRSQGCLAALQNQCYKYARVYTTSTLRPGHEDSESSSANKNET
jgi:hypothetical protein